MSDNAELIAQLRYGIARDSQITRNEAAGALERAERDKRTAEGLRTHWEAQAAQETQERNTWKKRAEAAECDLRAAAANEATMREALDFFLADERFHVSVGGNPKVVVQMLKQAHAALSAPASALAQRYEAVVTAARNCAHAQQITGSMWSVHRSIEDLAKALAALDHPTPAKDDSEGTGDV